MDNIEQVQRNITELRNSVEELKKELREHSHNGLGSAQIFQKDIILTTKSVGSVTMSTSGNTYTIGMPLGCKNIMFYGFASHYDSDIYGSGTRDVRVLIIGSAQLGFGYNLQPSTTTSVVVGGMPQNITQSSVNQIVLGPVMNTNVSEYYLGSVSYQTVAGGTVYSPATMEITKYKEDGIEVTVTLSAGWGIVGNFVAT